MCVAGLLIGSCATGTNVEPEVQPGDAALAQPDANIVSVNIDAARIPDARNFSLPDASVVLVPDAAGPDAAGPDAAPPDAFVPLGCDPVGQTGCLAGEKCTSVVTQDAPLTSSTECVVDGTVGLGGTCQRGEAGLTTGFDNCRAGLVCRFTTCQPLCSQTPDSCGVGSNCVRLSGRFDDRNGVGVCADGCDPVAQNCPAGHGCYVSVSLGTAACSQVPAETAGLGQDSPCFGPSSDQCYLNGCPRGFGAILNASVGDGSVCTAFCSPVVQHSGDTASLNGDPQGVTCAAAGAPTHECRFVNSFYSNSTNVAPSVGMCVPPNVWESCADHILGSPNFDERVPGCEPL